MNSGEGDPRRNRKEIVPKIHDRSKNHLVEIWKTMVRITGVHGQGSVGLGDFF